MKPTTFVVSDLHVGGGAADPGDDHVAHTGQFARFVNGLATGDAGRRGEVELYINGDFLEFAQTLPAAYRGTDARWWCSEDESLAKLTMILDGHRGIFAALGALMAAGNAVTIAAGNHDVDLVWPAVRARLRAATHDALAFEIGTEWVGRHGGRLQIAHGHLPDPVNTFDDWASPTGRDDDGRERLAMCPGTLFMVRFVNALEARYPFADNLHPVQNLAGLLLNDDVSGFAVVSWALLAFSARHPTIMAADAGRAPPGATGAAGAAGASAALGQRLLREVHRRDALAAELARAGGLGDGPSAIALLRGRLRTEAALAAFVLAHWDRLAGGPELQRLERRPSPGVLSAPSPAGSRPAAGGPHTLGTIIGSAGFGRESLRRAARDRASSVPGAEVVVMGHTHLPDDYQATHRARYFNPGSWTRYVDLDKHPRLRLDDLRDEARFPYALNCVRIDAPGDGGPLVASLETFEEQAAAF